MRVEFLIIGQGLAGTALAWRLAERGRSFVMVDRDEPVTSSRIAAGLVCPITGMRLSLNWRFRELYTEALAFYRARERALGGKFFHLTPYVRLLKDGREQALWQKRAADSAIAPHLNAYAREPLVDTGVFANPLGGLQQRHSGYLDTAAYLDASRAHFQSIGAWQAGEVRHGELQIGPDGGMWQDLRFDQAVLCTGWEAARHPLFDWAPFDPARGTILTIRADLGGERRIVNRGCWVQPRADGTARVGATYELNIDDPHTPAPAALEGLETKLRAHLQRDYQVVDTQTAVRPIIKGCKALLGRHPGQPRLAFFNGLGSKGVLRAPALARRLVEHLLDGAPLDPEFDLQANR